MQCVVEVASEQCMNDIYVCVYIRCYVDMRTCIYIRRYETTKLTHIRVYIYLCTWRRCVYVYIYIKITVLRAFVYNNLKLYLFIYLSVCFLSILFFNRCRACFTRVFYKQMSDYTRTFFFIVTYTYRKLVKKNCAIDSKRAQKKNSDNG